MNIRSIFCDCVYFMRMYCNIFGLLLMLRVNILGIVSLLCKTGYCDFTTDLIMYIKLS